jgi:hypothetical protein
MIIFSRLCLLLGFTLLITGCKSKKASLSGDEPVEVSDFIEFFPSAKLPYQFADTTLLKKDRDSLLISYKVFTQFVPDSILAVVFGKTVKPKIYPMARVKGKKTYLFAKTVAGNKRAVYVLGFNKSDDFESALPLLQVDANPATQQTGSIDKGYALTRTITRKNSNGSTSEGREVFYLPDDETIFRLVMKDPLDDNPAELENPIDTLPRKQKYAADYGSGKMNLVSFRDAKRNDRLNFFIHFEKNNGDCTGEIKGEAVMKSATIAEYHEAGEPCSLQFSFTSSAVTVKEVGGCGSRRGLRCSFNGVYSRKKEVKPKAVMVKPKRSSGK